MRKMISILCLAAFLLAGCNVLTEQTEGPARWPTMDWDTSTPAEQGMDAALLEQMLAEVKQSLPKLDSVLVIRNRYIVFESYFNGQDANTLHEQYSVTKSVLASLYGIALDDEMVEGVESPVLESLPESDFANTDARKEAMTVENLLTMTAGLGWQESDIKALYQNKNWVKMVMDMPMTEDPGTRFNYCSGCSHVLSAVLREAVGDTPAKFGDEHFFKPLGITDYEWDTAQGLSIGGWGLRIRSRDMAKLGYLYLNKGVWDGQKILPASWVEESTRKQVDNPTWRLDYGYHWWVARKDGAFAALGRDGQLVYVDPSRDLVVVFTADGVSHDVELDLIEKYVLPAVK